jgi:hypothetical protein
MGLNHSRIGQKKSWSPLFPSLSKFPPSGPLLSRTAVKAVVTEGCHSRVLVKTANQELGDK